VSFFEEQERGKKAHLPQVAIKYRSDVDSRETLLASPLEVFALPELKSAG
jgi:hypothetical protein